MDKLAIARTVLAQAEQRAGLHVLRSETPQAQLNGEVAASDYHVPQYLQAALPHGIPRRGVVSIRGSNFFALVLAGIASKQNAWVVFLGAPDVGWACAEHLGLQVHRIAHVPNVASQGAQVVSAAIDGFDVVVIGNVVLDARERRVLHRRALSKGTLLIAMNWPHANLEVSCEQLAGRGIEGGIGHVRCVDYAIATRRGTSQISHGADGVAPMAGEHLGGVPSVMAVPNRGGA
ncbi:hypothetical protein [Trueperella bialowiezensis]|uniref:Uncharacterized protein n=1 Tax=Trueperella bialowiezensis TaxID=312285 RepID=A0A448PBM7_9ACTO|nr:hypothetical protein [Trueperella bialowiezensis]VEI12361.1 Uncharacterised protein [Trueperella bialowiezensis]